MDKRSEISCRCRNKLNEKSKLSFTGTWLKHVKKYSISDLKRSTVQNIKAKNKQETAQPTVCRTVCRNFSHLYFWLINLLQILRLLEAFSLCGSLLIVCLLYNIECYPQRSRVKESQEGGTGANYKRQNLEAPNPRPRRVQRLRAMAWNQLSNKTREMRDLSKR